MGIRSLRAGGEAAEGEGVGLGYRMLNAMHKALVFNRRVHILAAHFAETIPQRGTVLDIGTGDGVLAVALMQLRPDLRIEGVDVLARPDAAIPVTIYDGQTVPFPDQSFDYVLISDVLHHTENPAAVLAEAARVARLGIVLKDHLREGFLAGPTLRFMDWVGNRGHNVVLPYNYLSRDEWQVAYLRARLTTVSSKERLGLYPPPFSWLFERHLHFVALLAPREQAA
jgi:SAM-dependent methyltransferase